MTGLDQYFKSQDHRGRETILVIHLLPPPVSLDSLCTITGCPPVMVLQIVEDLVRSDTLSRCREKGAGYYYLSDVISANDFIRTIHESELFAVARNILTVVCEHMADGPKRWMMIAHIYQVSGLPLAHTRDVVQAGHQCLELNSPKDAAIYYRMVLEGMQTADLDVEGHKDYADAAIGLCTCRDTALPKSTQRMWLKKALDFSEKLKDPIRIIRLKVLIAKTFIRAIDANEAEKLLEQAWQMLSEHDFPPELRVQVALANSELLFWQGYLHTAIERYESVIGNHEALPLDVETLKSCVRLAWNYGAAGRTSRGVGLARAVRQKARKLGARELEQYATLILVIILTDAGRIEEGEAFLKEVFNTPEEFLDPYTLWPGNGKKAFFAYRKGKYKKAFDYFCQAWENSKTLGTPHHRGPDNLEVMLGLEAQGMIHPEWNFESDIERLLSWPDIYMKGVALRFKALKTFNQNGPVEVIQADLKKSITLLTRSGAGIELSHARVLLARLMIRQKKYSAAEKLLKQAWELFSKINPDLFPKDLKPYLDRQSKNALWVESLLALGDALSTVRTQRQLLKQIISHVMSISGAERGCIFLRQDQKLEMVASRNIEKAEITSSAFSSRMPQINQVLESGRRVVQQTDDCMAIKNGNPDGTGWAGYFPIRLKSKILGVIFIDRGPTGPQLPENEISLMRIICNQAAVALENIEAYEQMIDLKSDLEAETHFYRKTLEAETISTRMIGRSEPFKEILNLIQQVARSDTTVMITGETGVGKDLVAQAIHQNSTRSKGPFIAVNVVSLSPELIASELFGHEKGAFTGASQTRKGRFELANNGTLFLDDIDAFSLDIQAKMLRVLETRQFERVGGTQTFKTRFRLVAASNRSIEDLVEKGLFRSDFYYRLNVFPIHIPALRDRSEDIPGLARYFMRVFEKKFGKTFNKISKKDMQALCAYSWPGNIRELRHVIERAVLLSKGSRLTIPPLNATGGRPDSNNSDEKILPLKQMEARHIVRALSACGGKVSGPGGAAALLDVKPTTLYSKMKRMGIARQAFRYKPS